MIGATRTGCAPHRARLIYAPAPSSEALAEDATAASTARAIWDDGLRGPMLALWQEAEALDLRTFESLETFDGASGLIANVDELAARALAVMQLVTGRFESVSEPPPSFSGPQRPSRVTANDVGSLAFVAQLELRQCRDRLRSCAEDAAFATVLGECDRTLRRLRRAIAALDSALAGLLNRPPVFDATRELSCSLRVRAGYRLFRGQILRLEEPTPLTVTKTLRLVGTSLAVISGKRIYSELRRTEYFDWLDFAGRYIDGRRVRPSRARPPGLYEQMLGLEPSASAPSERAASFADGARNDYSSDFAIPHGVELNARDVWPPVKRRGLLGRAEADRAQPPERRAPWAPAGAVELRTATGASLHSHARWSFSDEASARSALFSLVKRQTDWGELRVAGRALFTLGDEQGQWRVWVPTPAATTLAEQFLRQLRERDAEGLRTTTTAARAFDARLVELGHSRGFPASAVCLVDDRIQILPLEEATAPTASLANQLGRMAASEQALDLELSAWLAAHPGRLPSTGAEPRTGS